MLKEEGNGNGPTSFQPMKWGIRDGQTTNAVLLGQGYGPAFGGTTFGGGKSSDLVVRWNGAASTVETRQHAYNIPAGSHFLQLDGRLLVEIETFRVCPKPSTDTLPSAKQGHLAAEDIAVPTILVRTKDDVLTFGRLVAHSLMEEEMVLQETRNELAVAEARTTECEAALAAVYGRDVATGTEEDVVELSVRGVRVMTLRSTLQICPESSLATRFDEDKWPPAKADLDDNGRRVIDCKPSVFSKVLDVLRMAKRASWARGDDGQQVTARSLKNLWTCTSRAARTSSWNTSNLLVTRR
ncbi:unnamed protein product, partial [Ectocarpus fasciculatus]